MASDGHVDSFSHFYDISVKPLIFGEAQSLDERLIQPGLSGLRSRYQSGIVLTSRRPPSRAFSQSTATLIHQVGNYSTLGAGAARCEAVMILEGYGYSEGWHQCC